MKVFLAALFTTLLLLGVVGFAKYKQIDALKSSMEGMAMPPTVISSTVVEQQDWSQSISAVGTLEAAIGVDITADLPGRITNILFESGSQVEKGQLLLSQDTELERAQLRAADAEVALATISLQRVKDLYQKQAGSKAQLDTAEAQYSQAVARADALRTSVDKKNIRAPFSGKLGIRKVNVGQDLSVGTPIVSLQKLQPMLVNFSLPQKHYPKLQEGLTVSIHSPEFEPQTLTGSITAISSEVSTRLRNIDVQGTLNTSNTPLLPGMFVEVDVLLPSKNTILAVPLTAISHASFGDSVYVVTKEDNGTGQMSLIAKQHFVQLGETRGDFVEIREGLTQGQEVVSAGVFKLFNGAPVMINNDVQATYSLDPKPEDS